MKKTLLLSVVASTMMMAGGDIAPVVVAPVVEEVSNWEFGGQGVLYYQATDWKKNDMFDQGGAKANAGIQLRAINKDLFWGFGAGVEVDGVATLGLENDVVSNVMQGANNSLRGGWISQAYLTYGFGNTSIKAGRQELPKSLSPFAFSEGWNVFKNTFDSVLLVNTDISNTTIVGAWVESANYNNVVTFDNNDDMKTGDMAAFNKTNGQAGVYMLTVQNKSVDALTLTGSYYYAADFAKNHGLAGTNDAHILWGDAAYAFNDFVVAGQAGTIMDDDYGTADDVVAFGLKAGGNFGIFDASIAYSNVNDGGYTPDINNNNDRMPARGLFNVGGIKTPLYTQMILNQGAIRSDNDTFVFRAGVKALGGKFGLAYDYTADNSVADNDYSELDLTYKTKIFNDSTTLFAGYVYQNKDKGFTYPTFDTNGNTIGKCTEEDRNLFRVWGRYNF